MRRLPLSATEAYVLSRIDQTTTLEDLAEVVAMSLADARRIAERLVEVGALSVDGHKRKSSRSFRPPRVTEKPATVTPSRTKRPPTKTPAPPKSSRSIRALAQTPKLAPIVVKIVEPEPPPPGEGRPFVSVPVTRRSLSRLPKAPIAAPNVAPMSLEEYTLASKQAHERIKAGKANLTAKAQAQTFVEVARAASERGDSLTALHNYRIALHLHEDPETAAAAATANYVNAAKLALDAETKGDWIVAAVQWRAAHDARPQPIVAERLAHAIVRSNGDVRQAVSLAQFALQQEPDDDDIRLTLAEALFATGLVIRARTEAMRVLERDASHARGKDVLARIDSAQ